MLPEKCLGAVNGEQLDRHVWRLFMHGPEVIPRNAITLNHQKNQSIYIEEHKLGRIPNECVLSNEHDVYYIHFPLGIVAAQKYSQGPPNIKSRRKVSQDELENIVFPLIKNYYNDPLGLLKLSYNEIAQVKFPLSVVYPSANSLNEYLQSASFDVKKIEDYLDIIRERNMKELQKPYMTPFLSNDDFKTIHMFNVDGSNISIYWEEEYKKINCGKKANQQEEICTSNINIMMSIDDLQTGSTKCSFKELPERTVKSIKKSLDDKDFITYLDSISYSTPEEREKILWITTNFYELWLAFQDKKPNNNMN